MTPEDIPQVARQQAFAFGQDPAQREIRLREELPGPLEQIGRVALIDGVPRACGLWHPFPLLLGRTRIPAAALASVACDPAWRRRGAAGLLVRAGLEERRAAGVPLSILYAFSHRFYRELGYGEYPVYQRVRTELALLPDGPPPPATEIEPGGPLEPLSETYRACAERQLGWIDRFPLRWRTLLQLPRRWFLLGPPGEAWGYCALSVEQRQLAVAEWGLLESARLPALFAFWRSFRDQCHSVQFHAPAGWSWAALLEQPWESVTADMGRISYRLAEVGCGMMLRLLDPAAALAARPYPPELTLALEIEIDDPLLPANSGRYRLAVDGGAAEVSPAPAAGGPPDLQARTDRLASIYCGALDPVEAASWGLVSGSASASLPVVRFSPFAGGPLRQHRAGRSIR